MDVLKDGATDSARDVGEPLEAGETGSQKPVNGQGEGSTGGEGN